MNRKILFRGKSTIDGTWVYGHLNYAEQEDKYYIGVTELMTPVIPETVGQFTGLTDKNGVKIFEGDFVRWWSGSFSFEGLPDNIIKQADQSFKQWLIKREGLYDYEANGWYKKMSNGIVIFFGACFSIHNDSDISNHIKNSKHNLTSYFGHLKLSENYEITGNIHNK